MCPVGFGPSAVARVSLPGLDFVFSVFLRKAKQINKKTKQNKQKHQKRPKTKTEQGNKQKNKVWGTYSGHGGWTEAKPGTRAPVSSPDFDCVCFCFVLFPCFWGFWCFLASGFSFKKTQKPILANYSGHGGLPEANRAHGTRACGTVARNNKNTQVLRVLHCKNLYMCLCMHNRMCTDPSTV